MKRIIDVDENLICAGFVRNFTEEEKDVLISAIRNSIPYEERPQGDLISREALKEKAETVTLWNGDVRRFVSYETIDNAPTECEAYRSFCMAKQRPTGEWIKSGKTTFFCSECGREINTKPFTRPDNFPFCHCGAEMKGGAE